jgi:uncharacterized protein
MAIILGAIRMVTAKPPTFGEQPVDDILPYILWGFPLGVVSGIMGIGGGVLIIPILVRHPVEALRVRVLTPLPAGVYPL